MDNLGTTIITLLFTAGLFWWVGFIMQKSFNEKKSRAYHFQTNKKWAYVIGLGSKHNRIYVRFFLLQLVTLLYFIVGGVSIIQSNWEQFDNITGYFGIFIIGYGIIIGLFDLVHRKN